MTSSEKPSAREAAWLEYLKLGTPHSLQESCEAFFAGHAAALAAVEEQMPGKGAGVIDVDWVYRRIDALRETA